MTETAIPPRIEATPNDIGPAVMRLFSQHLELGCRLTFAERLDPELLRRAVRLALDAEPVLGSAFVGGFRKAWWQRLPEAELDTRETFSVIETGDPDETARRFLCAPVPDEGPQMAAALVRSAEGDEVCVRMSHIVADGQAVKQCAYLLADLYTRLAADPAYVPRPNLAARPQAGEIWGSLSPEERRRAKQTPKNRMPNWTMAAAGARGSTGRGRTYRELRLPPKRLEAIREYGRERGASVNEMLLTAFFRALVRSCPQPAGTPLSLPFTADLRRYLPSAEGMPIANLAISLWLGVEHVPDEPFDATLARVHEQAEAWKEALWNVRSVVGARAMARLGFKPLSTMMRGVVYATERSPKAKGTPVFTNIGVIDEQRLSFAGATPVDGRLSGPAAFGASFVPTVSTYRDTLTVSMGFCEEDMDASVIERVLGDVSEELEVAEEGAQILEDRTL